MLKLCKIRQNKRD